jgi:outer membrane lipoprotein-sorting protein
MKQPSLLLVACFAAVLSWSAPAVQAQPAAPTAESLLQQMAAAYASARSYSDHTFVRYLNPDGSERFHVDFKIWFLRPVSIRLDAESKKEGALPRREVLWSDGTTIRTWATGKPVVAQAKVRIAKSGMFGTYAYHVPTLLEPAYAETRRLHNLSAPTLAGEETVEGVDCYRISGGWEGDDYDVWIGKEDHLVRKIVAKHSDHQLEEIHRDVVLNADIPANVFRFAPEDEVPAAKKTATPPADTLPRPRRMP